MLEIRSDPPREFPAHVVFPCHKRLNSNKRTYSQSCAQQHPNDDNNRTLDHRGKLRDRTNYPSQKYDNPLSLLRNHQKTTGYRLNENKLDYLADQYGYSRLYNHPSSKPMATFHRGSFRLTFWLTDGKVSLCLQNPRKGMEQLFLQENVHDNETESIFQNPRLYREHQINHHWEETPKEWIITFNAYTSTLQL